MKKSFLITKNKSVDGFTLIEIMIVITLLGLIATFAVTNFMAKLQEGNRKGTKVIMKQLQTTLDDYMRNCNQYPTTGQGGLDSLIQKPADDSCKDYDPNGYLKDKKLPKDAWGRPFLYLCDDGKKYVLKSLGRDGKEGGSGDDKDISTEDQDF